ncbi:MAG: MurR/RpiR family transcriptional regulator [Lachnospiraceae bacterium]|nr:MurR/RpiR family transcriptional regulator [Lachnospiraceae bacterium]
MLNDNVFARISQEYYYLTNAEKKIADFITLRQQETQFMSISEMAEEVGVAEASISRFCRKLGYRGYNAFKLAVANSTALRSAANPLSGEVLPEDSIPVMCQKVYAADIDAITQTLELTDPQKIAAAADLLIQARRTLCMGQGGSMLLAEEAAHLFSTALPDFYAIRDSHIQIMRSTMLCAQDAVMFFSYSGATSSLMDILKIAKERQAKIILITRFPRSPGAAFADVVLECGSREGPLQLGSIAARMAQLYLIDLLFSEVCRRDIEGCRSRRKMVADALTTRHL